MKKLMFLLIMIIISCSFVNAAVFLNNDTINITEFEDENIYAIGSDILLNAGNLGDLVLLGNNIEINSKVEEDLTFISSKLLINEKINGDLRGISTDVFIDNSIEGELMLITSDLILTENAIINKKAVILGGTIIINGKLMDDVKIKADKVTINGEIYGNSQITANKLSFGENGLIKGNLQINENIELDKSKVDGTISHSKDIKKKESIFAQIYPILTYILVGVLIILLFAKMLNKTDIILKTKFLKSILFGILVLLFTPVIIFILMITIIGIPIGLLLLILYILMILLSPIFISYRLGNLILGGLNLSNNFFALILGIIYHILITLLPILALIFIILGSGAFFLVFFYKNKKFKNKNPKRKAKK